VSLASANRVAQMDRKSEQVGDDDDDECWQHVATVALEVISRAALLSRAFTMTRDNMLDDQLTNLAQQY
jgi:hypothetical protein